MAAPIRPRSAAILDSMGLSRSAAIGAFIVVLISGALIDLARGSDRVECEPQRSTRCGGLPSQDEDYELFVPEVLAE